MTDKEVELNLASLVERGGVYYNVFGANPKELLATAIALLPRSASIDSQYLYQEILEREALVSTGIGRGIALPHPRNLVLKEVASSEEDALPKGDGPFVTIIFPAQPLDWNAPDGGKVHTVFLIVSSSAKQHLDTLSKINFLCKQEKFYSLIKARFPEEQIIAAIREAETKWKE
jgi:PTS system nitrogen regulatory IIA component